MYGTIDCPITKNIQYKNFNIRTFHDCPSQMSENALLSTGNLTSGTEFVWYNVNENFCEIFILYSISVRNSLPYLQNIASDINKLHFKFIDEEFRHIAA